MKFNATKSLNTKFSAFVNLDGNQLQSVIIKSVGEQGRATATLDAARVEMMEALTVMKRYEKFRDVLDPATHEPISSFAAYVKHLGTLTGQHHSNFVVSERSWRASVESCKSTPKAVELYKEIAKVSKKKSAFAVMQALSGYHYTPKEAVDIVKSAARDGAKFNDDTNLAARVRSAARRELPARNFKAVVASLQKNGGTRRYSIRIGTDGEGVIVSAVRKVLGKKITSLESVNPDALGQLFVDLASHAVKD